MEVEPGWGPFGTCWGAEAPAAEPRWSGKCWSWSRVVVESGAAWCPWHPMHFWTSALSVDWVMLSLLPGSSEVLVVQVYRRCDLWVSTHVHAGKLAFSIFHFPFLCQIPHNITRPCFTQYFWVVVWMKCDIPKGLCVEASVVVFSHIFDAAGIFVDKGLINTNGLGRSK